MSHTCHARECSTNCPPKYLMCPDHWRKVPHTIRARVWATYQKGQERGDHVPSEAWHRAADEAIAAIGVLEGRITAEKAEAWVARHDDNPLLQGAK